MLTTRDLEALKDGASALRYRAERLAAVAPYAENDEKRERAEALVVEYREHADLLDALGAYDAPGVARLMGTCSEHGHYEIPLGSVDSGEVERRCPGCVAAEEA